MKQVSRKNRVGPTVLALLALMVGVTDLSTAKKPPTRTAAPAVPWVSPFENGSPESQAVLAALDKSEYRFSPEVKTAFISWRKAQALAAIAKTGRSLPANFLAWVDSDPVVAGTVYGIADNAAQRLVLLRSLEIDLGQDEVRGKHIQLALGITDEYAGSVNPATMSNPALGISLEERGLLKLEIKRYPCVKVDTHAKDRPLDVNDHIVNFLEDNPVITGKKVGKNMNGGKIETVVTNSRPFPAS